MHKSASTFFEDRYAKRSRRAKSGKQTGAQYEELVESEYRVV